MSVSIQKRVSFGASAIKGMGRWSPSGRKSVEELKADITVDIGRWRRGIAGMGLREKRVLDPHEILGDAERAKLEQHPEKHAYYKRLAAIEMGVAAANALFARTPTRKEEIDLLIYFSVTRAYTEPATAVVIQSRLGLAPTSSFDLSNACLGFVDAWLIADSMIASGRIRSALLISAELPSHISDICTDSINRGEEPGEHIAALSLGDGAVAALIGPRDEETNEIGLVAATRETFSEHHRLCVLPDAQEPMITKSRELLDAGVNTIGDLAASALARSEWSVDDVDACIVHQVSMPFIERIAYQVSLPSRTKLPSSFPHHGNMASVSAPFTLAQYVDERGPWSHEKLLYIGFGSGLGVAALTLTT